MTTPRSKLKHASATGARRPYDALKTKERILAAARRAFTDFGFDHVGVRDVAARAGVDPALVIRYYGSKEKLFLSAIGSDFDLVTHWGDDDDQVGARLAARIVTAKLQKDCYDPLLLILRSAPNAKAASLLRAKFEVDVIKPIAERLGGADAMLRAEMLTSVLVGIAFNKDVLKTTGLTAATVTEQQRIYAKLIQACIDR